MDLSLSQDLWDDELALIVEASNDAKIVKETYLPPKMSVGAAKRWFFGQKWGYFIHLDGKPVGMVIFRPKPGKRGVIEVETWILEQYRRLGISAELHPQVVKEASKWWDTMVCYVWETNEASLALLKYTGFVSQGTKYSVHGIKCLELALSLPKN